MTTRDIIVIGASLGGFQALCELLAELPDSLDVAMLVVLHTSPKSPRYIVDMLSKCTRMKVSYGEQGLPIERGNVYIAPPDHHMTVMPLAICGRTQGPRSNLPDLQLTRSFARRRRLWPARHRRCLDGWRQRWDCRSPGD
jgi:two-component system chemotaxis response regulator CheB